MTVSANPLVEDYLRRLEAAASALPPHRRDELITEIRGHLEEALSQTSTSDDVTVRNVLERLGPAEDIVDAATDPTPSGQLAAPPRETNALAVAALLLGVLWIGWIGSLLALVFGYRARRQIKRSGGLQQGSALATVGIVLGWFGVATLLLVIAGGLGVMAQRSSGVDVPVPTP
jgi:hypothetical protein